MTLPQDLTPLVRDRLREPDGLPPPRIAEMGPLVHQTPQERGRLPHFGQGRFQTMYSAIKLFVALVIVASFGSLLFAGVLVQQPREEGPPAAGSDSPSPTTTGELLSRLTTEEVEPGVFRILGDGEHELSTLMTDPIGPSVTTGHDGSVWLASSRWAVQLGEPGRLTSPTSFGGLQVGPDGTVWVVGPDPGAADAETTDPTEVSMVISSFDDGSWTAYPAPTDERIGRSGLASMDVATDGTVWASWLLEERRSLVARLTPDGWRPLPGRGAETALVVSDDGVVWFPDDAIFFRDGKWHRSGTLEKAAVSRSGAAWLIWTQPLVLQRDLGDGWSGCPTDGAPKQFHPLRGIAVAPDGSLWGTYRAGESSRLARFDCTEWSFPLADTPLRGYVSASIASDGSVWVLSSELPVDDVEGTGAPLSQLYVITPEAVAGTE